ncbi:LuxR C-terminal-related transcriptional regulator [Streptomyces sp. NPDC008163]|uniref:LuxR C-terminal-related transcriptional regulator n=1 Tax=Streptomyces sp. NPDC008163 TaxID=3364818 RepID=UPI0036E2C842
MVAAVIDFTAAIDRVAAVGGIVVDHAVIQQLVRRRCDPLERLSPHGSEVLDLVAQGQSNAGLAAGLFISEPAVNKHTGSVFAKLHLPTGTEGDRRVLAGLACLRAGHVGDSSRSGIEKPRHRDGL